MNRQIEIDFEVWKELNFRRTSEDVTENSVIRELLGLEPALTSSATETQMKAAWVKDGVTLPHGTELRMEYAGREYKAEVDNGAIVYEGERYKSPSPAAAAITNNPVNGWNYWESKVPGKNKWEPIKKFRKKSQK